MNLFENIQMCKHHWVGGKIVHWYTHLDEENKKFVIPGAKPHFPPDHPIDINHVKLEFRFDIENEIAYGQTTLSCLTRHKELEILKLDAKEMTIEKVLVDGKTVSFENTGRYLIIDLPEKKKKGDTFEVFIQHYTEQPRAGVYFVKPDEGEPNKPTQVWTQGQDEDSSYYFPCLDHPSFKHTSEAIIHVKPEWFALSNGDLVSLEKKEEEWIYHYKFDFPHSTYLITIVAGKFIEISDEWDGIKIYYYVPPGREKEGINAFGDTPKIIQFLSEYFGVKYPYSRYSQIAVADFIFGGMENTTATTQTDLTLHDDRAHIDFSSNPLVAHEAVHQWFGDYVTCKDWTHAWLNEGFATYFEAVFTEHSLGKDEFRYEMLRNMEDYFNEDAKRYRRPIVTNVYKEPIDMFDSHLYPGGAWRLHMLRFILGEDQFRGILKFYLEKHKAGLVETSDFQRAIEEVTGKNLDWFFDEFIYKPGYPIFKINYSWDKQNKIAKISVKQQQVKNESKNDTPIFKIPVTLLFTDERNKKTITLEIKEKEHEFYIPLEFTPKMFRFDPDFWVLKKIEWAENPPKNMLEYQLEHDEDVIGRIEAAKLLAKTPSPDVIRKLGERLRKDPFWGVQARIASVLANIGTKEARNELINSLSIEHPKARRGVVNALGSFLRDNIVMNSLSSFLSNGDESYYVEAEATLSLGKIKIPEAFDIITKQLSKDSHVEIIRRMALKGLAELEIDRSIEVLKEWSKKNKPTLIRTEAITALGKLGKRYQTDEILEFLVPMLKERKFRVKMAVVSAIEAIGSLKGVKYLEEMEEREVDGRIKRRAYEAINKIHKEAKKPEEIDKLRKDLEEMAKTTKELNAKVRKLEAIIEKNKEE